MFVGKIKKEVKRAVFELIEEGFVRDVITSVKKTLGGLPENILESVSKYVDEVRIDPISKEITIKMRNF